MTLSFFFRLSSGIRVSIASSTTFATLGTALTTLIILPILDILFSVLMGHDMASPDLTRTGYAAALVALSTSICAGIVAAVASQRNLGVFQESQVRRIFDLAYWLAVSTAPIILSAITGIISIGAVFILSPQYNIPLVFRVIKLAAMAIVCGLLLGVAAAGIGVSLPDPYLGGTVVAVFLPLLTGVIVPLSDYPYWLRIISDFAPMSATVGAISTGTLDFGALTGDLLEGFVLALIGLYFTRRAVRKLRSGKRFGTI